MKKYPIFLVLFFIFSSVFSVQAQQNTAKMGLMEANTDAAVIGDIHFAFRPIQLDILSKKEACEKNLILSGTVLIKRKPLRATTNSVSSSITSSSNSSLPVGTTKFGFPLIKIKGNVLLFEDDLTVAPITPDNEFKIEVTITEKDTRWCGGKSDVVDMHPNQQLTSLKLIVDIEQKKIWLQKSDGSKGTLIGKMGETLSITAGTKTKGKDVLQGKLNFKVFMKRASKPIFGLGTKKIESNKIKTKKFLKRK